MSVALVAEVIEFLNQDDCPLDAAERLTLLAIACRAGDDTRHAWQGGAADWNLSRIVGMARMPKVFKRLAEHGLEVRVQVGTDSAGRPVYAHRGQQTTYRVPILPTTVVAAPADGSGSDGSSLDGSRGGQQAGNGCPTGDPLPVDNVQGDLNGCPTGDPLPVDNRGSDDLMGVPRGTHSPERVPYLQERVSQRGPLKTIQEKISSSLAVRRPLADLGATADEERMIIEMVRRTNPTIRSMDGYLAAMARSGDLQAMLDELRAPQRRSVAETFVANARHMPECIHLIPGGDQIHPSTGEQLCPGCRNGAPAYQESDAPPRAATAPLAAQTSVSGPSMTVEPIGAASEDHSVNYRDLGGHGFCITCAEKGHFSVAVDEIHGSHCAAHARQEAAA